MAKHLLRLPRAAGSGALDIVSYGRRGPVAPHHFGRHQLEQIGRTVGRTPEVMVKVSGGARDMKGAAAHFSYVARHGKLEIETDDGRALTGKGAAKLLVDDWDLQLSGGQYRKAGSDQAKLRKPKLVHNVVLSMPAGTPPKKVLAAARAFAVEKFENKHRYAMVLHTDQSHPHVHLVVKAVSEQGERLYVRKETLREWRESFAEKLRAQGVAANATPRVIRGRNPGPPKDRIARASKYGRSTFMENRLVSVANEVKAGDLRLEPGKVKLERLRQSIVRDWQRTATTLEGQGEFRLAESIYKHVAEIKSVRTDREKVAAAILEKAVRMRMRGADARQPPALERERSR